MLQFKAGDTRSINGVTYERDESGNWRPKSGGSVQLTPPNPKLPGEITLQRQNIERGQQDIQRTGVQMEGDRLSNAGRAYDVQTKPVFDRNTAIQGWIDNVRNDKRITTYEQALPIWASALKAPETPEGDSMLTNAWAKTLDPLTGVQQGESQQLAGVAPTTEQVKAQLMKQFGGDGSGNFTPEGRKRIKEALTVRMQQVADSYRGARADWSQRIKAAGLPNVTPEMILGTNPGQTFQQTEADFLGRPIRNLDGTQGAAPRQTGGAPKLPGDIGFAGAEDDPLGPAMSPQQQAAYNAWWQAKPDPTKVTAAELRAFGQSIGRDINNAEQIIEAVKQGHGIAPAESAVRPPPDISDMRGKGGAFEGVDAFVRGAANVPMIGMDDEFSAIMNTIFDGGTMAENLSRERAIDAFDNENHFWARLGGQAAGGFAVPVGAFRTPGQIVGKSAALGGAYGFGSGEGNLGDRAMSAVGGAAAGAAAGGGLLGLQRGATGIRGFFGPAQSPTPPLVDPTTGRLNEVLESMTPAQRMAAAKEFGIDLPLGSVGDRTAAILERGLDILPPSAGVMNDARRITEGQVSNAAEAVASTFGQAKNAHAGGTAVQSGGKNWLTRFERISGKAYDAIPISDKADAALTATRATLDDLTSQFQSNPQLAEALKSSKLETFRDALKGGGLSWRDLKAFRSRIGYEIGEQRFSDSPTKDQLRALYAALSDDMRATASAQGPGALRAFERANTLYAQGQQRIDQALVHILGDDAMKNPEAAALAVQGMAQGGRATGNLDRLKQVRASTIKNGEWDEVSSSIIRLMGQPAKGEGRQFNPQTFIDNYANMAEESRALLFGGQKAELRQKLDRFVGVLQRVAGSNALRNTSNTAPGLTAAGAVSSIATVFTNPILTVKLGGLWAANFGLSKLWTSPKFVDWATGYTRLVGQNAGPKAVQHQIGKLQRLAVTNPEMREEIEELMGNLTGNAFQNDGGAGR